MKIRPVKVEVLHEDGRTDRYEATDLVLYTREQEARLKLGC
jgi:hypothetical protein